MARIYDTPAHTGIPKYYANWDANFWSCSTHTKCSTYEITLAYVKQPFSITDTTQPTGQLQQLQMELIYQINIKIYFICLFVEAYGYLKGPADMLQYYEGKYQRALQSYLWIEQMGRRRRDEYQDGVIRTPLTITITIIRR